MLTILSWQALACPDEVCEPRSRMLACDGRLMCTNEAIWQTNARWVRRPEKETRCHRHSPEWTRTWNRP